MRMNLVSKFSDHPKSNNMTYSAHFAFAAGLSLEFVVTGIVLFVHAVFPFWFKDNASQFAEYSNEVLNNH